MADSISVLLQLGLKLAVIGVFLAYSSQVLVAYATHGRNYRVALDRRRPLGSARGVAVWFGVKALAFSLRSLRRFFNLLFEASAEFGIWYLSRRDSAAQTAFRSRFLR